MATKNMSKNKQLFTEVSRRKLLKASAATVGVLGIGAGTSAASQADFGLVERENHRIGVPFNLTSKPVEPFKRFTCDATEPTEAADCFNILYEDEEEERPVAFETPDEEVEVGDELVFGPLTCRTPGQPDERPWHLVPYEEAD